MLTLLFLFAAHFAPVQDSTPNRQPQLAARGRQAVLTFGAGNTVYFAASRDAGATWSAPVAVSKDGVLSLGMRRGPRIALAGDSIVISAILGEKGRGADGDLVAWRSADGGVTWSAGKRVNDIPASAREGLHAMVAGPGNTVFAVWLDLRRKGTRLYGSISNDGGASWSANRLVYESPSGSICECCHPSAAIDDKGRIFVMFRNSVDGNRDMYMVRSDDGGKTFGPGEKLGTGSWLLKACPMDGGGFAIGRDGAVSAVWRREGSIYRSGIGGKEELLGQGRQPVAADRFFAWTEGQALKWIRSGDGKIRTLPGDAAFVSLAESNGQILAAGERAGTIFVEPLR